MNTLSRRSFMKLLGVSVAGMGLVACGGASGGAGAREAADAALSLFAKGGSGAGVPTYEVTADGLAADGRVTTILADCGLCKSRSEARQMVTSGAVALGEEKVTDVNAVISPDMIGGEGLLLRKGQKKYMKLVLK